MKSLVAFINFEEIEYDGCYCSKTCHNLKEGSCNLFSRQIDEPRSLGSNKTRLRECIKAQTLAKETLKLLL